MERERLLAAIKARHSVRKYKETSIVGETLLAIREKIRELNEKGNLHMQLVTEEPKGFNGIFAYGKFYGVRNYVIVAGKPDESFDYRVGYYGEELVIFLQTLGLNSCWAGLSYKKVDGTYQLSQGEKISCYIAIGYGENQGVAHKSKSVKDVSNAGPDTPDWFLEGVETALLAPTAVNQQKFSFEYLPPEKPGEKARVLAKKGFSLIGYTKIDLGIAKYHFEIGVGKNNFIWL